MIDCFTYMYIFLKSSIGRLMHFANATVQEIKSDRSTGTVTPFRALENAFPHRRGLTSQPKVTMTSMHTINATCRHVALGALLLRSDIKPLEAPSGDASRITSSQSVYRRTLGRRAGTGVSLGTRQTRGDHIAASQQVR